MNQKIIVTLDELREKTDKKESIFIKPESGGIIVVTDKVQQNPNVGQRHPDAGQRHPDIVEIKLLKKGKIEIKLSSNGNIVFELAGTKPN